MSLKNRIQWFLCIVLVLTFTASGCDLITAVKEYFQGPSEKTEAQAPAEQKAAPVQPPPKAVAAPMQANTLARVGNWSITAEEFEERLNALKEIVPEYDVTDPEARRLVLDELINQQVLVLGAEQGGLANDRDIKAAVEEFRRTLIVREVARQITENIETSEADARQFYNENKADMIGPDEWHVREIVVPTEEQAANILTEILGGGDFAQSARLYSIGETAAQGGDLGFITEEPFEQMGNALLPLEVGDVSGVFKGPLGYYIVKLEEKRSGAPLAFEDIKEDLMAGQALIAQQQAILDYLERLKAQTPIEINEDLLLK